ncbi:hypothetical protein HELRODRAFT_159590 [Helobdella robusta]|uniref:Uncharacterized protein n=1 Tax=Helobdella robusta TaxID=6412 RepID=T1EP75_HELRO|nr:hypothetical protein HELRODRAFT_159590 [Helobdella robusta]ESO12996.1 hypothetical protein HELRODRAFT_159590 [Helobdella robusta]
MHQRYKSRHEVYSFTTAFDVYRHTASEKSLPSSLDSSSKNSPTEQTEKSKKSTKHHPLQSHSPTSIFRFPNLLSRSEDNEYDEFFRKDICRKLRNFGKSGGGGAVQSVASGLAKGIIDSKITEWWPTSHGQEADASKVVDHQEIHIYIYANRHKNPNALDAY